MYVGVGSVMMTYFALYFPVATSIYFFYYDLAFNSLFTDFYSLSVFSCHLTALFWSQSARPAMDVYSMGDGFLWIQKLTVKLRSKCSALSVISGFRCDIYEICALLGHYAASSDVSFIDVSGQYRFQRQGLRSPTPALFSSLTS
jgi:hypothetical protein